MTLNLLQAHIFVLIEQIFRIAGHPILNLIASTQARCKNDGKLVLKRPSNKLLAETAAIRVANLFSEVFGLFDGAG